MLVLSRKSQESVVVGGTDGLHRLLKVTVLDIRGPMRNWASRSTPMFLSIVRRCGNESAPRPVRSPDGSSAICSLKEGIKCGP